jgi:hypothetical protein
VWACWHLVNATIPGLESYWSSFPAFLFFVLGQTIFFTWMWNRTAGSLLLMWILHATVNTSIGLFFVGNQTEEWWFAGAVLWAVAIIVLVVDGLELARRPSHKMALNSILVESSIGY